MIWKHLNKSEILFDINPFSTHQLATGRGEDGWGLGGGGGQEEGEGKEALFFVGLVWDGEGLKYHVTTTH